MIDLHMHSRYSDDGELSADELTKACIREGIRIMSITDHNCARAYRDAVSSILGKKTPVPVRSAVIEGADGCVEEVMVISGIEIDCTWKGMNFHLLGYGIDSESPDFARIERAIAVQSADTSMEMLRKTREMGFCIAEEEMRELARERYWKDRWTGEMFAEVLLAKEEYIGHPLLEAYRPGGARGGNPYVSFYWDYYAQGKPCYVEIRFPGIEEMIDVIHRSGGAAVLAHPGVNLRGREERLGEMAALGLDGVEAYSSYHTREQAAYFYREAKRAGLGITCGSDFHGRIKPAIRLGGAFDAEGRERDKIEREALEFLQEKVLTDSV